MKKEILITGIICLFVGVGIQPAFAVEPIKTSNIIKEENTNPKEYLFQTIIDIANNPDVKNLLEQNENDLLRVDIDKSIYLKVLFRNPRIFLSMLFTKPSFTPEYLDSIYDKGCQIIDILGEDEAKRITESVTITNPEFFDDLNNILLFNEGISDRMEILSEMNKDLNINPPFVDNPIICVFLVILLVLIVIIFTIIEGMIILIFKVFKRLPDIIDEFLGNFSMIFFVFIFYSFIAVLIIGPRYGCWDNPFEP